MRERERGHGIWDHLNPRFVSKFIFFPTKHILDMVLEQCHATPDCATFRNVNAQPSAQWSNLTLLKPNTVKGGMKGG